MKYKKVKENEKESYLFDNVSRSDIHYNARFLNPFENDCRYYIHDFLCEIIIDTINKVKLSVSSHDNSLKEHIGKQFKQP